MYSKKFIRVLCLSLILSLPITNVKATEECFEGVSRAMFSFNMAFDDIILEPIAKGYNKSVSYTHLTLPTIPGV